MAFSKDSALRRTTELVQTRWSITLEDRMTSPERDQLQRKLLLPVPHVLVDTTLVQSQDLWLGVALDD